MVVAKDEYKENDDILGGESKYACHWVLKTLDLRTIA
jgi:hypothetical protein